MIEERPSMKKFKEDECGCCESRQYWYKSEEGEVGNKYR